MGAALRALVVVLAMLPALARGAPNAGGVEEAKTLFKRGQAHYNVDEFPEAAKLFKQAYLLHPDPTFLYNIAQCHRKMGDAGEALSYFRKYLRTAHDAPNRDEVERRISELEGSLSAARSMPKPSPVPGAPIGTGGGMESSQASSTVAPGNGSIAPRGSTDPTPTLALAPEAPSKSTEEPRPLFTRWWVWALAGAVVAAGASLAIVLARPDAPAGFTGSIPPGRVSVPDR